MRILKRLLEHIDSQLDTVLDRHLALAIPEPRRSDLERIGSWSCCPCCGWCLDIHRDACPEPGCGQGGAA